MQIDWDKAPEWANWIAKDPDGLVWWHEEKPEMRCGEWASEQRFSAAHRLSLVDVGIKSRPVESPATLNALDNDYFL